MEEDGRLDEREAIRRLKHGEAVGLEVLVQNYQVRAVRTAYLITHDLQLAEDVVQDAFLGVYHSMRSFDSARPFGPWFLQGVVHAAVRAMKKTLKEVQLGDDGTEEEAFAQLTAQMESVESQVMSLENSQQIWDAMQKLSPRQRAVIVQRYFLEMSEKEMATELKAAPGTIKWLLNAARERLRVLLVDKGSKSE